MLRSIPVFYRLEMVADGASYSPSAGKPSQVVKDWVEHSLPIDVRTFDKIDEETLSLAHEPGYVRGVLTGNLANGFGNRRPDVASSLPYTSGAMLAAAQEAIANRNVACAPVSGFHHACYEHAEGFCTFNGLMVTALSLRRTGQVQRVGILDLDHHWGNGTEDIIRRLKVGWILHHSSGHLRPLPGDAGPYLSRLPGLVNGFKDCGVLLYQAGADAHVKDPLGGWMTNEQLAERDEIVFRTCAEVGLPVAWNLAGGYQVDAGGGIAPVLEIHRQTMKACCEAFVAPRT
jgi:acetoin utilization deacetylase AcuC-like enzyme